MERRRPRSTSASGAVGIEFALANLHHIEVGPQPNVAAMIGEGLANVTVGVLSANATQTVYTITFTGALSDLPEPLMSVVGNSPPSSATLVLSALGQGFAVPGVFTGPWSNLTGVTTPNRKNLAGIGPNPFPSVPGPDDDFRIDFPEVGLPIQPNLGTVQGNAIPTQVTWSSVAVVDEIPANGLGGGVTVPVVYAALGTGVGSTSPYATDPWPTSGTNAVYWSDIATFNGTGGEVVNTTPSWYIGNPGVAQNEIVQITVDAGASYNLTFGGFQTNQFAPLGYGTPAGVIQNEITALPSVGAGNAIVQNWTQNVNQDVYDVQFTGALGLSPQTPFGIIDNPPGSVSITIIQIGGGADTESTGEFPTGTPLILNGAYLGNIKIATAAANGTQQDWTLIFNTTNPNPYNTVIYASVSGVVSGSTGQGVYVSLDGGLSWTAAGTQNPGDYLGNQGAYDNAIAASAASPDVLFVGGTAAAPSTGEIWESSDGGTTFFPSSVDSLGDAPASAEHAIAIAPNGNLVVGNDGGVWSGSFGTGAIVWNDLNTNLAISQINGIATDPTTSIVSGPLAGQTAGTPVYFAGSQSNGTEETIPNSYTQTWTMINPLTTASPIESGGQVVVNPQFPEFIYDLQSQILSGVADLQESTTGGGTGTWANLPILPISFTQTVPLVIDSINTSRLLVGGSVPGFGPIIGETKDGGTTWLDLFPPLANPVTAIAIAEYQGPFEPDPRYTNIYDNGTNTYDSKTIYTTDGTTLLVTKDDGQTWMNITAALQTAIGLPALAAFPNTPQITDVVVDPATGTLSTSPSMGWATPTATCTSPPTPASRFPRSTQGCRPASPSGRSWSIRATATSTPARTTAYSRCFPPPAVSRCPPPGSPGSLSATACRPSR